MILTGHDEPWREWRAAVVSERMHHAWILAGTRGLGKGAFARAAARELVDGRGGHHPESGAHPDILVLDHLPANDDEEKKRDEGKSFQTKRNITIDQIRRMQQRLVTRPTLGERRAVIIDPADDLEKNAVNALLKSLEEPPAGTFFLLVTHRPGRLLPTVRSRCRVLRFAPLASDAMDAILQRRHRRGRGLSRSGAGLRGAGTRPAACPYVAYRARGRRRIYATRSAGRRSRRAAGP
jgi:DNA polymerase-3 subunit delta'